MRKEYGKLVRDLFSKEMRTRFPKFEMVAIKGNPYVWPGERIFLWKPRSPIHCYVILSISPQYDEFYVHVGWSSLDRFPHLGRGVSRPTPTKNEYREDEFLVKASYLCGDKGGWGVSPMTSQGAIEKLPDFDQLIHSQTKAISAQEAREVVKPVIEAAMSCLAESAIPYLDEYLQANI
jgi:hypothetical protein